jgi:hypothetical protein
MELSYHNAIGHYNSEDLDLNLYRRENLKSDSFSLAFNCFFSESERFLMKTDYILIRVSFKVD